MTLISKADARTLGMKRYFSGKPCVYGHVAQRFTGSGICLRCHAIRNAARYETRKAAGIDVHAPSRKSYAKNPERGRAASKRWRKANALHVAKYMVEWEVKNRETRRAIYRRRKAKNPDHINAVARTWNAKNQWRRKGKAQLRKAAKFSAVPAWVDRSELRRIYASRADGMHVDHIIPLVHPRVCGLHVPWNLQYLPERDNLLKGNRL